MTDPQYTHLTLVLDRSGSMSGLRSDMEPAIQQMLDEQDALPGKMLIDVVTFDTDIEFTIEDAQRWRIRPPLIHPRGGTALLDAVGMTINRLGQKFHDMAEDKRPGTVIIAVVTDGMENSSHEFNRMQVKAMVEHQQDMYGWTFTFLGANMDAVSVAGGIGVPQAQSMTYDPTSQGVTSSFVAASSAMSTLRGGGVYAFKDSDREAAHPGSMPDAPVSAEMVSEEASAPSGRLPRFGKKRK